MSEPLTIPTHDQIERRAYRLWEARGCPIDSPEIDWLRAEMELTSECETASEKDDRVK